MPDFLLFAEQLKDFTSGIGTYARGLARGLSEKGYGVTVAVPESQAPEGEPYQVLRLPFAPGNVTPTRRRRMRRAIRRILAGEGRAHDLVHFLDARWATCLPSRRLDRPVLGTVHDTYALDWRRPEYPRQRFRDRVGRAAYYAWLRRIERAAYDRPTRLLANSEHVRRAVVEGYGIDAQRIQVVRLGLPDSPPAEPVPLSGDPAVLFVGGNYQRKGLSTLLAATARVRSDVPGMELHVVGHDLKEALFRRQAEELGIGDRVRFHGWVENDRVRGMMAAADVFAMPSYVEAFGLVYLEAMRAGTPVVATALGGAAECFEDGVELRLVPPDRVEELAAALRELALDPDLAARRSAAGRQAAERVSFDRTLDETLSVYLTLA